MASQEISLFQIVVQSCTCVYCLMEEQFVLLFHYISVCNIVCRTLLGHKHNKTDEFEALQRRGNIKR